jgi:monofunctional biosynthetic peptidoglycan transglycosylase
MARRFPPALRRVLSAIAIGLGLLVAVPLVLVPAYLFVDPVSTPMLERWLTGKRVVREWRPIDGLSDRLKAAVVMSEDGQFCSHFGVDPVALQAEVQNFLAGRPTRGASTLTMQVARNLFLTTRPWLIRKVIEVPLALYIDLVMPKKRIMEIYLNIAEWGPDGEFGVVAGAQRAFGIDASSLSWERAGLLTVALPNPQLRRPDAPSARLLRVAGVVEQRARRFGQRAACVAGPGGLSL